MIQPLKLKGKPWLTSISAAQVKAGALYLHCFYVAKARPEAGTTPIRNGSLKEVSPPTKIQKHWTNYRMVFASHDASGARVIYAITGGYQVAGTGKLWRFEDNGGPTLGNGVEVDAGWEIFKFAFASGNGMIYAVDKDGGLFRCQQTGPNKPTGGTQIGEGWQGYRTAFATSKGVIYAIDWQGYMAWYRDLGGNQIPNPVPLGSGWGDFRMIFATSDGGFYMIRE